MIKLHETMEEAFPDNYKDVIHTSEAHGGFIKLHDDTVSFKLQAGPVSEYGVNGVQCEEMLMFVAGYLRKLNSHKSCVHNETAIKHIEKAITSLHERTADRVKRGVEGTEKD